MANDKTLLGEGTIRRFMKLAEIAPLTQDFLSAIEEEAHEPREEADVDEYRKGEEEGEKKEEDEMLDLDMDDLGAEDEGEAMDLEVEETGELTLSDEEAEAILVVADKIRAAMDAAPEPEVVDVDMDMDDELEMDADLDVDMGDGDEMEIDTEEEIELQETGKKRTGASKRDKGKDPRDPSARDYTDEGDREGDESETHPGKDYKKKVSEATVNEIATRVLKRLLTQK